MEEIIRQAFYNLYVPGCDEHYLAHTLRTHEDFLPALDMVIELDGQIIGNILYTKARLIEEAGGEKHILSFGPVCILPGYQRKGYGKQLIEASFQRAVALGYDTVVIFGNPDNYVGVGFKSCMRYNVCLADGSFPSAMMVRELKPAALDGRKWVYAQSPAFEIDEAAAERFDAALPPMEKKVLPSQEEFYIHNHSIMR